MKLAHRFFRGDRSPRRGISMLGLRRTSTRRSFGSELNALLGGVTGLLGGLSL